MSGAGAGGLRLQAKEATGSQEGEWQAGPVPRASGGRLALLTVLCSHFGLGLQAAREQISVAFSCEFVALCFGSPRKRTELQTLLQ